MLAIVNIGVIVTIVFGFLTMSGWGLGLLESILCVLVVGFSIDFTVHLADAYMESVRFTRYEKTEDALVTVGVSILSGAASTCGATFPMFFAQITFFSKFGYFMFLTMGLSLFTSLGNFCAMLMLVGPEGHTGQLHNIYGPIVVATYRNLLAEEEHMEHAKQESRRTQKAGPKLSHLDEKSKSPSSFAAAGSTSLHQSMGIVSDDQAL